MVDSLAYSIAAWWCRILLLAARYCTPRSPNMCSAFSPVTTGVALVKRDADANFTCRYCDYKNEPSKCNQRAWHLAYKHDIGVEWHFCTQTGCDFKAKQKYNLKWRLA